MAEAKYGAGYSPVDSSYLSVLSEVDRDSLSSFAAPGHTYSHSDYS